MDHKSVYENALKSGRYIEHTAGDISGFRYPHMKKWEKCFEYDSSHQVFMFKGSDDELREIAAEDITVYEFIAPEAKMLHLSDMLACSYTEEDRRAAMQAVAGMYEKRKSLFGSAAVSTIRASDMKLRDEFVCIAGIYEHEMEIPVRVVTVDHLTAGGPFPFGSVLKGTNIMITDGNVRNLGQDMVHMLFHLKEGIEGPDCDNMHVSEIWADVPDLYALQLTKGRMARRIRKRPSPHPIHFTDYIYLRAYLGLALEPSDTASSDMNEHDRAHAASGCAMLHPVYGIIEPAVRLIFHALKDMPAAEINRILADAVLCDKTDELIAVFDSMFGEGSFSCIYDQYSLYDKYRLTLQYIDRSELDEIMFRGPGILPTEITPHTTEEFWRKRLNEDTSVLPAGIL